MTLRTVRFGLISALLAAAACGGRQMDIGSAPVAAVAREAAPAPEADYWVFVANESSDLVSLVRFGPGGAVLERDIKVDLKPADLDGVHGVTVSPDGKHLYVTIAHGTPFGYLWKLDPWTGERVGETTLGRFPATIGIVPDGSRAFIVNFNLHGRPVPSSVSAVFLPTMNEEKQIETCVKPHGSRLNLAGTRAYSVCVGDDQLVEISVDRLAVTRRLDLNSVTEGRCGPTWITPSADDAHLFVACNKLGQILELDADSFEVVRRLAAGKGTYNLAASRNGRFLLATNKGEQSVSVFDLTAGKEVARLSTTRPVTHGVVISPDDRYAFVSNESIGAVPGTVDVIDLGSLERVASVEVRLQAGGIDFWRMENSEGH